MENLNSLLIALNEETIVRRIQIPHDEARNRYHVEANTVRDFDEFTRIIGDYYNHHFSACISHGGRFSSEEAASRAKQILAREYRRRNGDIVTAFQDAQTGLNTGLRGILDKIAEALKAEAVENYVRHAFDKHVAPNVWDRKVEIIRQFMAKFPDSLPASIRADQPERCAANYEELIRGHVANMQQTSAVFRRL